ncbi:MAG: stage III sporulation protein AF [Clostridia bacterium]|nr:stage III sporulation protein AF [Clostridium sp.]
MIEFLSSWAKGLGLAIVVVSILEMILPNNKTKKYIRMVMGVYILFTIISPFIKNKQTIDVSNFEIEKYNNYLSTSEKTTQTSMDKRIEELYIDKLEKDISKKVKEQGYDILNCEVEAKLNDSEENSEISKIKLQVKKNESNKVNDKLTLENKVVEEIQKIRPINTNIVEREKSNKSEKITNEDKQKIKKFLMEEYGVKEKCLEIN